MKPPKGLARLRGPTFWPFLLLGLAAGCASALRHPDAADAAWAEQKWSGTSLEALREGRERYVETCAGCHQLYQPGERSSAEWETIVQQMQDEQDVVLTDDEAVKIYRYLVTASRKLD